MSSTWVDFKAVKHSVSIEMAPFADDGARLPSGVYFVRVAAGLRAVTRRWVVVR